MAEEIIYRSRYSDTDEYDHMDRWARIAYANDIHIAWINKIRHPNDKEVDIFTVSCHFPTKSNDTANEFKKFDSLDEDKEWIVERWNWFLKQTSKTGSQSDINKIICERYKLVLEKNHKYQMGDDDFAPSTEELAIIRALRVILNDLK